MNIGRASVDVPLLRYPVKENFFYKYISFVKKTFACDLINKNVYH